MATVTEQALNAAVINFQFEEESHTYTNTVTKQPILSVTQVLDSVGIVDYSNAPTEAMSRKSELGSAVHRAVQYVDASNSELNWDDDKIDDRIYRYILGWYEFCQDTAFVPQLVEHRGCVKLPQGEVGFMVDRVGLLNGELSAILEIKCTCREEESWKIQLAGYELCELAAGNKPQGSPVFVRAAVQLLPERINGKLYKIFHYQDPQDRKVFQWALALASWKMNHGYKL
jgi:hypothetical protein